MSTTVPETSDEVSRSVRPTIVRKTPSIAPLVAATAMSAAISLIDAISSVYRERSPSVANRNASKRKNALIAICMTPRMRSEAGECPDQGRSDIPRIRLHELTELGSPEAEGVVVMVLALSRDRMRPGGLTIDSRM